MFLFFPRCQSFQEETWAPSLCVSVLRALSFRQTVFLCRLAHLVICLTFIVLEADGVSLGYKFVTP